MRVLNRLGTILAFLFLVAVAVGPLEARTRKGEKFLQDGRAAEVREEWDKALELFEKALEEDPGDAGYQMAVRRVRFQAGQAHVKAGRKLRDEGKLEEALAEFQKAYATDPGSSIAEQELRRTHSMIRREKEKGEESPPEEQALTPADRARQEAEERADSILPAPELKPISRQISTLRMNNQPVKVLFETVGKLAGINVVFDPEYQAPPRNTFTVDLTHTTLEAAFDYLSVLTKSYWKPLSSNTIFVTNDNVTKRRDYEDMVVKVFYLTNITKVQELQEITTAVRSVTDIRRMFTYNSQNAILVRGTVDQVALAEKLIQDLDKPLAEVVVDVIVMEANRARTRDLAATFISGGQPGINIPIGFKPRAELSVPNGDSNGTDTTTGGTTVSGGQSSAILLSSLGRLGARDFSLTLPGALLNAVMSDRGTRVLQSPQVRAADGQKASLRIGDRFPYATGSFQPGIGAVGVSPLVSTQFQFADVGVNVDITPKIHGDQEVSLHVELDVSNVRDRIDVGGLSQPVIGQRKLTHDIRIREGQVSLLGGLMQDQDTRTQSGVPGLGNLPIIRRLFSSETKEKNESELLIALIPHIVRAPEITPANIRGVAAGTDQLVKLSYAPKEEEAQEQPAAPVEAPPTPVPPVTPAPAIPGVTPPPPAEAQPSAARLAFNPAAVETKLGAAFTVTLNVDNGTDVFNAPMRIKFDPKILRLNEVTRGGLLAADGQQIIFTRNILNDSGDASIVLNRLPGTSGISGSGILVTFAFQAVARGTTQVTVPEINLRNSQMQPIAAQAPSVAVTIQ